MDKKEMCRLGILYASMLLLAMIVDFGSGKLEPDNSIQRMESGGDLVKVNLLLDAPGILEQYPVLLEVEAQRTKKEEADIYFQNAKKQIDEAFQIINETLPIKDSYSDGRIKANWGFTPVGFVNESGEVDWAQIPEEGLILTASAQLRCDAYEEIYCFPIELEKRKLSAEESIKEELAVWIEAEQAKEGEDKFSLPNQLAGIELKWSEKKEYLVLKLLMLEAVSVVLILWGKKKEKEEKDKKLRMQRELLYPEIVNQLLILLESGMTIRQAWHRIAVQYKEKRRKNLVEDKEVYREILQMDRRLTEGESERFVYEWFGKQMEVQSYRRLIRLLLNNLEKGSKTISQELETEAKQAYDQRIMLAKKLGEEASTKLLLPMMLMMVIVMAIVIIPAMMGFAI